MANLQIFSESRQLLDLAGHVDIDSDVIPDVMTDLLLSGSRGYR